MRAVLAPGETTVARAVARTPAADRGPVAAVLALQRTAGNRAVTRMLQRQDYEHGGGLEIGDEECLKAPRFRGDELLNACCEDRARLHVGMKNRSVFKVQQALYELHYDVGRRGPDGDYGPRTAAAVKKFKEDEELGFEQYGDVGPGTMRRLDQIYSERRHDDDDRRKKRGEFPRSEAKVEVLATEIGAVPHYKHLFIVHTGDDGKKHAYRAGPGNCLGTKPPAEGDAIMTDHGPYEPGFIDWDPKAKSVTALRGMAARDMDKCLWKSLNLIDRSCLDYKALGPNSNTVARHLLKSCGIPQVRPEGVDTPGWDDTLPI
jgi:hypothetical protein